jgi:probable phosphoglycerate mutase
MPKKSKDSEKNGKPTTILLVRHGENEWTEKHKLAGRVEGVHLNEYGRQQAEALGQCLAKTELSAIYASPLERTMETATAIAKHHKLDIIQRPGIIEVDYGEWTGQAIKKLAKEKSWPIIQFYPTGANFPAGETMYHMQSRMVQEINQLAADHRGQTIALIGHADLIKAAVAHYLGVHFDLFQRIVISTASITAISFTEFGPRVLKVNDTAHNPPKPEKKGKKKRK